MNDITIILITILSIIVAMALDEIDNPVLNKIRKYRGPIAILGGIIAGVSLMYQGIGGVLLVVPIVFSLGGLIQWRLDVKKQASNNKNFKHNE